MIDDAISRHKNIALQFSGGKDSLACLYLLRNHLDRIKLYWVNTGSAFPETLKVIDHARSMGAEVVEIDGKQPEVIKEFGIPSDVVPVCATPIGQMLGHGKPLIQDRYSCCFRTIMQPMLQRMQEDNVTLIIRGQRNDDPLKPAVRSGMIDSRVEYLFPVEGWSSRKVLEYLKEQNAPVPRFYQILDESPDCMTCSAWWEKGAAQYLKRYHCDAYAEVQRRLDIINEAVSGHIAHFNKEVL